MNKEQRQYLLKIARLTISSAFENHRVEISNPPAGLDTKAATFVTLTLNDQLRGCIGSLEAYEPIIFNVIHNARSAAFNDYRFQPVIPSELKNLKIEISVLSPKTKISYTDSDHLLSQISQKDGLVLEFEEACATFLPQVWQEIPNKKDFLASLCQKAGFEPDLWRHNQIDFYKYTVEHFSE